jgi:spartin
LGALRRYGPVAAENTRHVVGTAKNVALVYIDMRGIGRKALLRRAGRELATAQLRKR